MDDEINEMIADSEDREVPGKDSRCDDSRLHRPKRQAKRRTMPSGASFNAGGIALLLSMLMLLFFSSDGGTSLSQKSESIPQREPSKRRLNHERHDPVDYTAYSCDELHHLQAKYPSRFDRCEFAKTCNEGEGIVLHLGREGILFPSLFCDDGSSNQESQRTLLLVFLALVTLLLFRLLGSTTDEFFLPGLEMFSLKLGLPPRFAGVTLLALGNGAPDVAATMNAILTDKRKGYEMALGVLTGTGMFVTSLILGAIVMLTSSGKTNGDDKGAGANEKKSVDENGRNDGEDEELGGVPCRGPLLRDIAVLILVCAVSMSYLKSGVVDYGFIYTLLGMYGSYVLLVLCADIYHIFYHAPSLARAQSSMNELGDNEEEEDVFPTGGEERPPFVPDEQTSLVHDKTSPVRRRPRRHTRSISDTVIEAISNYSCHEEGPFEDISSQFHKRSSSDGTGHSVGWGPVQSDGTELGIPTFHPRHAVHPHHGTGALFLGSDGEGEVISRPGSWGEAWSSNAREFVDHWRDFFADIYRNDENSVLDVIFLTVELPFTVVRKLTNPVPCDGYYCRPMVALSVALSPVWVWWYFLEQFDTNLYSSFVGYAVSAITLVTALAVIRYSPGGEGPMDTCMVIPLTLYGFSIAATWLDSIADKLVDLLDLFGILLQIPRTVMGLTILAFGSSLQDVMTNVSLSKKGLSTMATTACFAGPVFNFCVGLGFGFWTLLKSTGKDHIRVELPRNIATGFWFTIANCGLIVFTGVVVGKGVIGRPYGYVACGLYVVYVVTSIYI